MIIINSSQALNNAIRNNIDLHNVDLSEINFSKVKKTKALNGALVYGIRLSNIIF